MAVSYVAEGAKNALQELYVVNNTYINERLPSGSFLRVAGHPQVVQVINNLIAGSPTVLTRPGEITNKRVVDTLGFADAVNYDYRLTPQSPALRAGVDPGKVGEFSLSPVFYYRHPLSAQRRAVDAPLNIGACP